MNVSWCEEHVQKRVSRDVVRSQLYVCYLVYRYHLVYHLPYFPLVSSSATNKRFSPKFY